MHPIPPSIRPKFLKNLYTFFGKEQIVLTVACFKKGRWPFAIVVLYPLLAE